MAITNNGLFNQQHIPNNSQYNSILSPLTGMQQLPLDQQERKLAQMKYEMNALESEINARKIHTPIPGPTPSQLETYPALKNSWDAYLLTKKLIGL